MGTSARDEGSTLARASVSRIVLVIAAAGVVSGVALPPSEAAPLIRLEFTPADENVNILSVQASKDTKNGNRNGNGNGSGDGNGNGPGNGNGNGPGDGNGNGPGNGNGNGPGNGNGNGPGNGNGNGPGNGNGNGP